MKQVDSDLRASAQILKINFIHKLGITRIVTLQFTLIKGEIILYF